MNLDKIKAFIKLIRPHHYAKNFIFIFAPLFFALKITDVDLLLKTFVASIAFTLVAGVVYIINDYKDIEDDKQHPKKKFRPLASGAVTKKEGIALAVVLSVVGFTTAILLSPWMAVLCLGYLLMNLAYSFGLKHIAVVDIFILSTGFVIRLFVGAVVGGIMLTHWIVIMVFLLAIFLSLAKRRDDVMIMQTTGKKMRKSMDGYNEVFVNGAIMVTSAVIIVAYIMYTTLPDSIAKFHSENLYLTSIFVIFGIFRYMQITFVEVDSGSPVDVLIKDRWIQLTLIGWIATFALFIYL